MDQAKTRVLIVDDHPLVRRGLVALIEREPGLEVCGEADGESSALEQIAAVRPDVAVVDIMLKDGNGLSLIAKIRAAHPSIRIVVSSMHDERLYARRALAAGAMGYVDKQESADRVVEAIHRVLAGKIYLSNRMARRVAAGVRGDWLTERPLADLLSAREMEVLQLIGEGKTTREIAKLLQLSVKTVDTYREHLKAKLNLESANELLRLAVVWQLEAGATILDRGQPPPSRREP